MPSVLIIENEPVMEEHTRAEVLKIFPDAATSSARTVRDALHIIKTTGQPDWILLDLGLPDARELDALLAIHPMAPASNIVVISGTDDQDVRDAAMKQGAFAFISKEFESEAQFDALKLVLRQHVPVTPPPVNNRASKDAAWMSTLTRAEKSIVELLRQSLTNKQIAQRNDISEATVKKQLSTVFRKAGLGDYTGNKRSKLLALLNPRRVN
jgi:DNA-binding NarL/FixJ family response regulator